MRFVRLRPAAATMIIRFKKTRDGCILACTRPDGSVELQRSAHGGFFASHDLLHFAVETTLNLRESFFGLVSDGWSFDTFADKSDPRYRSIPSEALYTEHLVGTLSRKIGEHAWEDDELLPLWTDEVNAEVAAELARAGHPPRQAATPEQLRDICTRYLELCALWGQVPVGEHLELTFE